jgi:isochorismate pyruvate lyase
MKKPAECESIEDVRNAIDAIDRHIVELIGTRAQYVHEVVKYKTPDKESVVAAKRRAEVFAKRREWALEEGLDPDVIESVYHTLVDYFIRKEMRILNIE